MDKGWTILNTLIYAPILLALVIFGLVFFTNQAGKEVKTERTESSWQEKLTLHGMNVSDSETYFFFSVKKSELTSEEYKQLLKGIKL